MHLLCLLLVFHLCSPTGQTEDEIVNGHVSKPHSRPYMASLQYAGRHFCGGVLIQDDFVLTAAHCRRETTTVILGAHDLRDREKSQQHIQVSKFLPHPKYSENFDFDIMLLKLQHKARLNKNVATIALPAKNKVVLANLSCVVAGWGKTGRNKLTSNVLREALERTQFNFECAVIWQNHFSGGHMICTKFNKSTGGVCQGDSGGPLLCKNKLEGITAYTHAEDCNNSSFPHVFTKIRFFLPWIKKTLQKEKNVV